MALLVKTPRSGRLQDTIIARSQPANVHVKKVFNTVAVVIHNGDDLKPSTHSYTMHLTSDDIKEILDRAKEHQIL